ncbi:MAG TPA: RNA polymerase sigma factor [Gemmatimonadaceae bacterium]|nr:RNA polymerase sigma factor [Gemmatimonadaceae bacterium]
MELVRRVLAGDPAAEDALYAGHVETMRRIAFQLCGDPDLTADIVQDAFVEAFSHLGQFRGEAALRSWLVAITIRCAGRIMRRGSWLRTRAVALHDQIPAAPRATELDLARHLDAAVARLSDKLRVVVVMHDIEGYTHAEIGAVLGIPAGTSKARLSDARAKLRAALEPHWKDRST